MRFALHPLHQPATVPTVGPRQLQGSPRGTSSMAVTPSVNGSSREDEGVAVLARLDRSEPDLVVACRQPSLVPNRLAWGARVDVQEVLSFLEADRSGAVRGRLEHDRDVLLRRQREAVHVDVRWVGASLPTRCSSVPSEPEKAEASLGSISLSTGGGSGRERDHVVGVPGPDAEPVDRRASARGRRSTRRPPLREPARAQDDRVLRAVQSRVSTPSPATSTRHSCGGPVTRAW